MIDKALFHLRPGAVWSMSGDEYEGILWLDKTQTMPSREEIEAEVARLQADYDAKLYQRQRAPEYPPLSDLADALYWQAQGNMEPMNRYMAACEAVKAKYPKGNTNG